MKNIFVLKFRAYLYPYIGMTSLMFWGYLCDEWYAIPFGMMGFILTVYPAMKYWDKKLK